MGWFNHQQEFFLEDLIAPEKLPKNPNRRLDRLPFSPFFRGELLNFGVVTTRSAVTAIDSNLLGFVALRSGKYEVDFTACRICMSVYIYIYIINTCVCSKTWEVAPFFRVYFSAVRVLFFKLKGPRVIDFSGRKQQKRLKVEQNLFFGVCPWACFR